MKETFTEGQTLLGYGYWDNNFNCPYCGSGCFMIQAGPVNSSYHTARCWCGATAKCSKADVEHELLHRLTNSQLVSCPGCDMQLERNDLQAQMRHMEAEHPDIIADRRRKANG